MFNQLISKKILPCLLCAFTLNLASTVAQADGSSASPINGLVYLINSHADVEMDGLLRWEQELAERDLTAMIKASSEVLETYPAVFKRLAEEGHEIIGGYSGICWDKPYDEQYEAMKAVKSQMEDLTGRPMKVFACAYSSYDENTVRAAEALGVPYLLARGTEDVRALVYQPEEYKVGILEVSNVEFGSLGSGSLCDISLYSRGASEEDFAQVIDASVSKSPDSMILVSHPHIGGTKVGYWNVYEKALDSSSLTWRTFEDWLTHVTVVTRPYARIPENREVQYLEPKPAVPLDQLQDLPEVGNKLVIFHNGRGTMCKEAKAYLDGLDYPVEEHVTEERNFLTLLDRHRVQYNHSEGASESFEYFPIIFLKDRAFSGFNPEIRRAIDAMIQH